MVDKFKEILNQLKTEHGDLTMFALLKMDEITNKWSLLVSAPWINAENRRDIFVELVKIMNGKLAPEESITIARIGLIPTDAHIVKDLTNFNEGVHITEDTRINGNIIHEAHILASNPLK